MFNVYLARNFGLQSLNWPEGGRSVPGGSEGPGTVVVVAVVDVTASDVACLSVETSAVAASVVDVSSTASVDSFSAVVVWVVGDGMELVEVRVVETGENTIDDRKVTAIWDYGYK